MNARGLIALMLGIAPVACQFPASAEPKPGDPVIIVVTASYPGANCQEVADTVAAPIEMQIHGAEGLLRIESESKNDGSYTARLQFEPTSDPKLAVKAIEKLVGYADPTLPEVVRAKGIAVKAGCVKKSDDKVTIALIDRGRHGLAATRKLADAVMKRLTSEALIKKPAMFPLDEKQSILRVDRKKCSRSGVNVTDVYNTVQAGVTTANIDALKKLEVKSAGGNRVPLGSVAVIEDVIGPAAIFRVNLYPAIRISAEPPEGKSTAESASQCVDLAEAELKRSHDKGFAVADLTAK